MEDGENCQPRIILWIMELPINKTEFEKILSLLKYKDNALFAKLLTQVRTFLTHWFQVAYLVVYLGIRLLLLLESLLLERLSSLSLSLRIFLILTPMVIVSTLILRLPSTSPYLNLGVLTLPGW
jgi:hypothetical protein